MTLEEFTLMVRTHDLTYAYSDDPSVYRRGRDSYDMIVEAAKQLPREDVVRIWNEEVNRRLFDGSDFYWK